MNEYEKYQLLWMIDHGHSLSDLIEELQELSKIICEPSITQIYEQWKMEQGFGGEIWACEREWEEFEGLECDQRTTRSLINKIKEALAEAEESASTAAAGYDEGWDVGEMNAYEKVLGFLKEGPMIDERHVPLKVETKFGTLIADAATDPDYPGIDVEFIRNGDEKESGTRPRVLIEIPQEDPVLRCLIWNDPNSEDYSDEIEFKFPIIRKIPSIFPESDKALEFMNCVAEIHEAIKSGILKLDPNDKNRILVYRTEGSETPAACYSQNILDAASELLEDKENYENFKKAINESKQRKQEA